MRLYIYGMFSNIDCRAYFEGNERERERESEDNSIDTRPIGRQWRYWAGEMANLQPQLCCLRDSEILLPNNATSLKQLFNPDM